ncbi:tetratricopeptide repeat protein [Bradyrhizobium embrapense]
MLFDRLIGKASPEAGLRRAIALIEKERFAEALPHLARMAEAGSAEAAYHIGRLYLQGAGVPYSRTEGARWLERSALNGNVEAQSLLASLLLQGLGSQAREDRGDAAARLFSQDSTSKPDFDAALRWAHMAADAGSPDGQALLAYILTYGPPPLRDQIQAREWYSRSASAGCAQGQLGYALSLAGDPNRAAHRDEIVENMKAAAAAEIPTAVFMLGVLTEGGISGKHDPTATAELYRKAAELGHRGAQIKWGTMLIEGTVVARDLVLGETWLRRAALAGDARAAELVGNLYAKGGALPPNYVEAASWYRRAAEGGNAAAARSLSSFYMTGAGVPQDNHEAARWLRIAAEAGNLDAQVDVGNDLLERAVRGEECPPVADWFMQTAQRGNLVAAFNLGVCLLQGIGVERNEQQAAVWLRRAAEGVPEAQLMIGRLVADGRGVPADPKAARGWFARAAEGGITDAQVALAEMLVNGRGGPQDAPAALKLCEQAAANGHAGAMFALGAMYSGGHAIPVDRSKAERWFRAAAERGHGQAQLMLGRYLRSGAAGHSDPKQASYWFEMAAAQGIVDADAELADLTKAASR